MAGPHGTLLCLLHLVLGVMDWHLGNSPTAAATQSAATQSAEQTRNWHRERGGGGSGVRERKSASRGVFALHEARSCSIVLSLYLAVFVVILLRLLSCCLSYLAVFSL